MATVSPKSSSLPKVISELFKGAGKRKVQKASKHNKISLLMTFVSSFFELAQPTQYPSKNIYFPTKFRSQKKNTLKCDLAHPNNRCTHIPLYTSGLSYKRTLIIHIQAPL